MISYEWVTASLHLTADGWNLLISWRSSNDDCAPRWHSIKIKNLQVPEGSLDDILECMAEELFNQAETAEQAGLGRESQPAPSGEPKPIPLF